MPMKSEEKEVDINEVAITFEVDSDLIGKVRSGEVTHLIWQINEDNQNLILETVEGHQLSTANISNTFIQLSTPVPSYEMLV